MKIKNQLYEAIQGAEVEDIKHSAIYRIDVNVASEECEKIVEDIAIQFADWLMSSESNAIYDPKLSTKELFEAFKQEKGL